MSGDRVDPLNRPVRVTYERLTRGVPNTVAVRLLDVLAEADDEQRERIEQDFAMKIADAYMRAADPYDLAHELVAALCEGARDE